jgi:outer membrane protein TolC
LERGLTIAQTNLETARKMLANSEKLFKQGYVTDLEVEGNAFTVTQARLELEVVETEIDVLKKYTKEMRMETLNGNLTASKSKLEADNTPRLPLGSRHPILPRVRQFARIRSCCSCPTWPKCR